VRDQGSFEGALRADAGGELGTRVEVELANAARDPDSTDALR
jgi:hypothetical protein